MAKLSAQEIIDSLKEMTLLEIKEVVDLMKEEFGVDPSAVAAQVPAQQGAAAGADEGPSEVDFVLVNAGTNKINVIKLIKEVTGLGLGEAKAIADNGGVIKEKVAAAEAEELKAKFVEAGAEVECK